jgi:hypothetical protein
MLVSVTLTLLGLAELYSLTRFGYRLSYEEGVAVSRKYAVGILAFFGAACCAGIGAIPMRKGTEGTFMKLAAAGLASLSLIGLVILCINPGKMGVHSTRSAVNECAKNIRAIESVKREWAITHTATNGTEINWDQIKDSFPRGIPACPSGGEYQLGKIGEPVACSVHRILSQ